jgi:protein-L-isoaspartate O-methyltransferase
MNPLTRVIRGDDTRKTRFHTSNGHLCLNPLEILRALGTSFNRLVLKRYARTPWLSFSAVDYLEELIPGRRVFEFGSGMSTLWFAERCREVVSVESDSTWHRSMTQKTDGLRNVRLVFANSKESYLQAIATAGDKFDLILIDGLYRKECLDLARPYLSPDGILVVDNTDTVQALADQIRRLFNDSDVKAFRGWVPGNLHPIETTIIQNIPSINAVNPSLNLSR